MSPVSLNGLASEVDVVQARLTDIKGQLEELLKLARQQEDKTRTIEVAVFRIGRIVDNIHIEVAS